MKKLLLMLIVLLGASSLWAQTCLEDIRVLSAREEAAMAARYPKSVDNPQLFSSAEFETIRRNKLGPIIAILILHPQIVLTEAVDLIDFAQTIVDSGYTFAKLEPRILKGIKEEMTAFHALAEAIDREGAHQWREGQVQKVKKAHGSFLQALDKFNLNPEDKEKVVHVYGACIGYLKDETERAMMKPSVCDPMEKYPEPRHAHHGSSVRTTPSSNENARVLAYRRLATEARTVAQVYSLDDFERIKMSKCVAEQAIRFFKLGEHPFRALDKMVDLHSKSPEDAFFMHTGVCANFSAIAFNFANEIGLKGRVFLASKGLHTYLEFETGSSWYHVHPFNNQGRCDITRF